MTALRAARARAATSAVSDAAGKGPKRAGAVCKLSLVRSFTTDSARHSRSGHKDTPNCPDELFVETGLFDSRRRRITEADAIWPVALSAWHEQDTWTETEHALFWRGLLPAWPLARGQEPTRELKAYGAALLARDGLTEDEIGDALGIAGDSVRRLRLVAYGEELIRARAAESGPLLPRVYDYRWSGGRPQHGRVNARDHSARNSAERASARQYLGAIREARKRILKERGSVAGLQEGERATGWVAMLETPSLGDVDVNGLDQFIGRPYVVPVSEDVAARLDGPEYTRITFPEWGV